MIAYIKKSYIFLFTTFYIIYSLAGILFHEVEWSFALLSLIYLIISIVSFNFFFSTKKKFKGEDNFVNTIDNIIKHRRLIIYLYFGLEIMKFIFPNFRLQNIFLPKFDFVGYFENRFAEDTSLVISLIGKIQLLVYPLFLLVLARLRFKTAIILVCLDLYLSFADKGYIGRGALVINFFIIVFGLFFYNRKLFRRVIVIALGLSPFILWAFVQFGRVRLGADQINISYVDSFNHVLLAETYTSKGGEIAVSSNDENYILEFFRWIFFLPIPSGLTSFPTFELNYWIAEDIHGVSKGDRGFTVTLIGLLFESIYVFGINLFWIHAIVSQYIIAFILKVGSKLNGSVFLIGAIIVNASYTFNRAGSASFYPFAINSLLIICFLYIYSLFIQKTFKV